MALKGKKVSRPVAGTLITFVYNAKTKDKLPYFDKIPIVLVLRVKGTDFWGLNMHYLPKKLRIHFMKNVMVSQYETLSKGGKSKLKWRNIKNNNLFKFGRAAIKHYLKGYVKTKIVEIDFTSWPEILNTEGKFSGAARTKVFKDTMQLIKSL